MKRNLNSGYFFPQEKNQPQLEKELDMVDFANKDVLDDRCPHEKAFTELFQFMGKEIAEAKLEDVDQWVRNLYCIYSHLWAEEFCPCVAWSYVVDAINGGSPDPQRPYTYHKTKAKIDELDARVKKEETEDEETNQT